MKLKLKVNLSQLTTRAQKTQLFIKNSLQFFIKTEAKPEG